MTTRQIPSVVPQTAPDGYGSVPEYLVYQELVRRGKVPGVDFIYQTHFFGVNVKGAIEVDFIVLPDIGLAVQGVFVHYNRGADQLGRDRLTRIQLASIGLKIIFLDEDNIQDDVQYYVGEALNYRDHSRATRGL